MDRNDFKAFGEELAAASAEAILPFFRTQLSADDKAPGGAFDPVTEADRAAERVMRRLIGERFPEHGIIGEEFGIESPDAPYVWVLDPIDGTKSFIAGFPTWGTLIGLTHQGRPCFGVMNQPFTRERFAGDGTSAHWAGVAGGRSLHTRACRDLAQATLMTTHPSLLGSAENRARFAAVERDARLSRYGGDCYAYCALAAGHVDLVIEAGLKPYDIVALIPIIEGAGGRITTWDGGDPSHGGAIVAAGDPVLHEAIVKRLA